MKAARRIRFIPGLVLAAVLATTLGFAGVDTPPAIADVDAGIFAAHARTVPIIVQKSSPTGAPEHAVARLGGTVTKPLGIVHGFAATVPTASVAALSRVSGVRVISLDRKVAVADTGGNGGSPTSVYPKVVRSDTVNQAGYTGRNVTVAVVDTGIDQVPDLAGRIVPVSNGGLLGGSSPCKNFSGESTCDDSYGHGTFVAGIIAGNGASSNGKWTGVAPQANLLSVKIAGASGAADVSTLLAAIQWIVSYKNAYNIKVLNLSLGTDSTQTYRSDPMNYPVEQAWGAGIAVVVAASNNGPNPGTISKPGDDPWVITVGAIDDQGTPALADDSVPNFSSRGPTAADGLAKPDVAAPGAHIVSLRAPGSVIDTQFPNYVDGWYRKGSGTSMATAVATGAVALMIQANPTWSPDRIKYALATTTHPDASSDPLAVGSGVIDAYAASFSAPPGTANAGLDRSTGLGSLDLSRGTVEVQLNNPGQTVVNGLLTAQLLLFNPLNFLGLPWTPLTWSLSQWYGSSWYGSSWYGSSWYGSSWYGSSWYGSSWYGSSWYGSSWYGAWE